MLVGCTQDQKTTVLACYVAKLCTGVIILAICITVNTIKLYIQAVVNMFCNAKPKQVSPLVDDSGREMTLIKDLLAEAKRWQNVPNRKEPLTIEMINWMYKKAHEVTFYGDRHNVYAVMADWYTMGLQTGYRKSE